MNIKNITPNLIILSWLMTILVVVRNDSSFIALICLFFLVFLGYLWAPFFSQQFILLGIIIAPIVFLHKKLTGNFYADFAFLILITTFIFYFLNNKFDFSSALLIIILKEIIYDFFAGIILILFLRKSNEIQ